MPNKAVLLKKKVFKACSEYYLVLKQTKLINTIHNKINNFILVY